MLISAISGTIFTIWSNSDVTELFMFVQKIFKPCQLFRAFLWKCFNGFIFTLFLLQPVVKKAIALWKQSGCYLHTLYIISLSANTVSYSMKPVNMLARSLNSAVVWPPAAPLPWMLSMSAYGSRPGWMMSDVGCRHCDITDDDDWAAAVAVSLLPPTVLQSLGHNAERMLYCADAPSVAYVEADKRKKRY